MRKLVQLNGEELVETAIAQEPFGPGFPISMVENASRLDVWTSCWEDENEDFTEFRLYRGEELVSTKRVLGY